MARKTQPVAKTLFEIFGALEKWQKETFFARPYYCDGCPGYHEPGERWTRKAKEAPQYLVGILCAPCFEKLPESEKSR